jgi:hypothetical protein
MRPEESSLDGTYSGANESGTLALTYDSVQSNVSASLTTVAGSYTTTSGQSSLAIANGSMALNSTAGPNMNCVGNGTVSVPNANRNIYTWNMTFSGCTVDGAGDGLAFLIGGNNLIMIGRIANVPLSLSFTK